jgi:hypothetical protein
MLPSTALVVCSRHSGRWAIQMRSERRDQGKFIVFPVRAMAVAECANTLQTHAKLLHILVDALGVRIYPTS